MMREKLIFATSIVLIVIGVMLLQASTWELMWYQSCTSRGSAECFMPEQLQPLFGPSAVMISVGVVLVLFESTIGKRNRGTDAANNLQANHQPSK